MKIEWKKINASSNNDTEMQNKTPLQINTYAERQPKDLISTVVATKTKTKLVERQLENKTSTILSTRIWRHTNTDTTFWCFFFLSRFSSLNVFFIVLYNTY